MADQWVLHMHELNVPLSKKLCYQYCSSLKKAHALILIFCVPKQEVNFCSISLKVYEILRKYETDIFSD